MSINAVLKTEPNGSAFGRVLKRIAPSSSFQTYSGVWERRHNGKVTTCFVATEYPTSSGKDVDEPFELCVRALEIFAEIRVVST